MNDFRKQIHVQYKKQLANIILQFLGSLDEGIDEFSNGPEVFVEKWVDSNCLPMGDFSKEDAFKEMEEWQNTDV